VLRHRIGGIRLSMLRLAAALGYALVSTLTQGAIALARPLLIAALRALVRSRAFWERGLANAWADQVPPPPFIRGRGFCVQVVGF
jgi:hypothetical protein